MSRKSLDLLNEGIRRQKAGFRALAASLYTQVPQDDPYHADALNLLGTVLFEEGRMQDAARLIGQAVRNSPGNATAWANLGGVARHITRPDAALACYRRAVLLAPNRADGLAGLTGLSGGRHRRTTLRRRLALWPLDVDAHIEFGNELAADGANGLAAMAFRRVQLLAPASPAGAYNHGNALRDTGEIDGADLCYRRDLSIAPGSADILNNRGLLFFSGGSWPAGEACFRQALAHAPDHAAANGNLARTLQKRERPNAAVQAYRRGLLSDPAAVPACCEIAGLMEAESWARRALAINPFAAEPYNRLALLATRDPARTDVLWRLRQGACIRPETADVWYNIGVERGRSGDAATAVRYCRRATQIDDGHALAHLNTALALLVQERFAEGWEEHRRRLDSPEAAPFLRRFAIPEWTGQDLAGARLLVWGEQGIGDEIQFLTLAPALLRRGAALTVLTEPRLRPILRRSFPGIAVPEVATPTGGWEDHHGCDLQIALGDLPHRLALFCGGEVRPEPWIVPDPERAMALRVGLLARHRGKRLVGITWRSIAPKTGARRSIPIDLWRAVAAMPEVALVSLQYGAAPEDYAAFAAQTGQPIDHAHGIEPLVDLDGLAALVAAVDLVVAPANNTVHFAGALAKPCWTLLPTRPDWRWGLTRDDSLWYPQTRVFRQQRDGDWEPVMVRVAAALGEWVEGQSARAPSSSQT
ncbi:tetratricopeptide repeat protein [Thalassobaculum litoreum]|uniref:Flp pilus assembly protein TadD, contains TPR repeats n=1 Tax=Thalassobaculum litoreum DSM 18839 TaxID=1123362 RepID=A0A8G2F2R3_9PROT|nr:tetratricopeptide repeat protein [Thalassobaculum litoreum]SDF63964.1 Flp pilus assembly protein TadD, contains TPR repeats [Thalassobaculum litoreum DSM 18839]